MRAASAIALAAGLLELPLPERWWLAFDVDEALLLTASKEIAIVYANDSRVTCEPTPRSI